MAKPVDKRADIWAFGVVVYEMFTGSGSSQAKRSPTSWRRRYVRRSTGAHCRRRLLLTSAASRRCLERDPHRRLRDIGEARITLAEPARKEAPASITGVSTGRRFTRMLPWGLALAAIAVAAWALWATQQSSGVPRDIVHLDIGFPPNVEPVAGRQGGIAISPDGKAIAMVGFKNGQRRLFVRRLDSPEALDVTGTSGAGVFSPDGRSVAFISNATALTRISLADGQSSVLTSGGDFVTGVSLAWRQKHSSSSAAARSWTAPPEGGEPKQLTSLDPAQNEVLHADPSAAPGRTFHPVLAPDRRARRAADRIDSAGGGTRAVVVENATTPVWSPTGHLLFGREGAVWAVAFDPETARAQDRRSGPSFRPGSSARCAPAALAFRSRRTARSLSCRRTSTANDSSLSDATAPSCHSRSRPAATAIHASLPTDDASPWSGKAASSKSSTSLAAPARLSCPRPSAPTSPSGRADGTRLVFRRYNVPFWATPTAAAKQVGPEQRRQHVPRLGGARPRHFHRRPAAAGHGRGSLPSLAQWRVCSEAAHCNVRLRRESALVARQALAALSVERDRTAGGLRPTLSRARSRMAGIGGWRRSGAVGSGRARNLLPRQPSDHVGRVRSLQAPNRRSASLDALFNDVYDFGQGLSIPNYDVTRDGRFLMLRRGTQGGTLRVVLNWTEELKRTLAKANGQ